MISYAIQAALESGAFSEVYVNSESEVLGAVAEEFGARFYQRPAALASNETINDEFAYDFIQQVPGDVLVQILPTSPLITSAEIRAFVETMVSEAFDALVSVEEHQIASLFQGGPINFSRTEPHRSSQGMVPVQTYATVLMGWTYESFTNNMERLGCGYHGGEGKVGYFPLSGLSTIDVDHESDFALAEVAMQFREHQVNSPPRYYEPGVSRRESVEVDVPTILRRDGVLRDDFSRENQPLSNLADILAEKDNSASWCHRIVNTESNSATLISQLPGEGNRLHYHPNWNEWWYIVKGQWRWEIEGEEYVVGEGDFVFIEKNKRHKITAIGTEPAVRLAVSRADVPHIYPES